MLQLARLRPAALAAAAAWLLLSTSARATPPPQTPPDLPPGMAQGAPPRGSPPIPRGMKPPPQGGANGPGRVVDDGGLHAVISDKMQDVISVMLPEGPQTQLPGGAVIQDVQVGREKITAIVKLADGTTTAWLLTVQLSRVPKGESQKFIITQRAGDPPLPELDAAIKKLVLAGESAFQWQEVRAKPTMAHVEPGLLRVLAKVDTYLAQGNMRAASLKIAESMVDYRRENMDVMPAWDVGVRLMRVGRKGSSASFFDRILELVEPAMAKGPVPNSVWQRYAGALWAKGRHADAEAAVANCSRATGKQPSRCGVGQMAEIAALEGDLTTAVTLLDRALAQPVEGDLPLVLDRIAIARRLNKPADVLKYARMAVARWPKSHDALAALASAEVDSGSPAAGIRKWLGLFEDSPDHAGSLAGVADGIGRLRRAELEQGADSAELDDLMRDLLALSAKNNDLASFGAAMIRYHRGQMEEAFGALTRLQKSRPKNARVLHGLALSAYWLGHVETARRHADNALRLAPADPASSLCRSVVRRPDDLPGAATDLERHIQQRVSAGAAEDGPELQGLKSDLELLKADRMPPDRLRPQGDQTLFGRGGMPAPWIVLLALALLAMVTVIWVRKRGVVT